MVKIRIQNRREDIEKQKQDIDTYYRMIDELSKRINKAGLHMSYVDIRESRQNLDKSLELSVEVLPSSLLEDNKLIRLYIKVHKEKALDIVKEVLKDYSNKYNCLEEVCIDTYF